MLKAITIGLGGMLVFLGLGIVVGASQWDVWARKGMERQLGRILDTTVHVGGVQTDVVSRTMEIRDFVVNNPRTFDVGPAIEIPRVTVTVDPETIFRSVVVFPAIHAEHARIHLYYDRGAGSNIDALLERARTWREASYLGWRPPGYRVDTLTSTDAQLIAYALGRSATIPLADIALHDLQPDGATSSGAIAAAVLRRVVGESLSAETVPEGLRARFGEEIRKWMGKTPM